MKIIDTHTHYYDEAFDEDRHELIDRLLNESVEAIINIGCSINSSVTCIELSKRHKSSFASIGIHPEYASEVVDTNYIEKLRELAKDPSVVAIGEIGLDYYYEGYIKEAQQEVFRQQILLANELSLPVIIHSRDATEDTLSILKDTTPENAVMHCYSGSAETAKTLLELGIYFSFTGVLTFKNAKKAVAAVQEIPLDRIMLETDCPYMAPVPFRGKRCDSSMTLYTAQKLAEIKGISAEEAISICNENAKRFFKLDI